MSCVSSVGANMDELRGKGWRVLGYFVWMLGAGIALDSDARGIADLLMMVGLVVFLIGAWQSWVLGAEWERNRTREEPGTADRH
jgi:hypothetical protein